MKENNKYIVKADSEKQKENYEQILKFYGCKDVKVIIPQPELIRSKSM